eukprot:gene7305-7675_t
MGDSARGPKHPQRRLTEDELYHLVSLVLDESLPLKKGQYGVAAAWARVAERFNESHPGGQPLSGSAVQIRMARVSSAVKEADSMHDGSVIRPYSDRIMALGRRYAQLENPGDSRLDEPQRKKRKSDQRQQNSYSSGVLLAKESRNKKAWQLPVTTTARTKLTNIGAVSVFQTS